MRGEIGVSVRHIGERFEMAVWDTGAGIPANELSRVFDPFPRLRANQSQTKEALGMGLMLVREFVNLHGGYLQILSEEGQGSRFAVLIPAGRAQLPQERVGDKSPGPSLNTIVRSFV